MRLSSLMDMVINQQLIHQQLMTTHTLELQLALKAKKDQRLSTISVLETFWEEERRTRSRDEPFVIST